VWRGADRGGREDARRRHAAGDALREVTRADEPEPEHLRRRGRGRRHGLRRRRHCEGSEEEEEEEEAEKNGVDVEGRFRGLIMLTSWMAVGATRRCPGSPEVGARSGGAGNCAAVARLRCIFFLGGFCSSLGRGPRSPRSAAPTNI
jgi:hypothetical protein